MRTWFNFDNLNRVLKQSFAKRFSIKGQRIRLNSLEKRREIRCLRFAKKHFKNEKFENLFPLNKAIHEMMKRNQRKQETRKIKTTRFENSAILDIINNQERKK